MAALRVDAAVERPAQGHRAQAGGAARAFLVGAVDAAIVASGMAGYDGHRRAVYYFAVDPEQRGRGLGRSLMQAVASALAAAGCPKINVMIRGDNVAALEFYRRLEFTPQDVVTYGLRLIPDEPAG